MSGLGLQMGSHVFEMSRQQNRIRLADANKKELRYTKQAWQEEDEKRCSTAGTETERTLDTVFYSAGNLWIA